ncbi:MAG: hypothetical protein ACREX0_09540 [Noviherbaspirillum sp.]
MKISSKQLCLALTTIAFVLCGCAMHAPRTYTAKENDPTLILKSTGMPMNVEFAVNSGEVSCENFEHIGIVRDSGRGVLLPWIANMTEKLNSVPTQLHSVVPAHKQVQVRSYGKWYDSTSKGSCGPLVTTFTPQASSTYLVEFMWEGTARCASRVSDITNSLEKKSVPTQFQYCPRSFMSILLD